MPTRNENDIEVKNALKNYKEEEKEKEINYTIDSLNRFKAKTKNQKKTEEAYRGGKFVICDGIAGTGKTFTLLNLMFEDYLENDIYEKIVIVRSAVATRDIGFLPGTEEDKMAYYEAPYEAICSELFSKVDCKNNYKTLKNKGIIEFLSTSHIRGITLKNSLILVDEVENLNYHEIKSIVTRVGENSKIFLCGDEGQTDLIKSKNDCSGFEKFKSIANNMDFFKIISFDIEDIVRSSFVKSFYIEERNFLNSN